MGHQLRFAALVKYRSMPAETLIRLSHTGIQCLIDAIGTVATLGMYFRQTAMTLRP